jgi:CheY-like chemotaxis protein
VVEAASVNPPRAYRILVVDDDQAVAAATVAMLEDLGHVAVESGSAEHALQVLDANPDIEIVLTDHAMPDMTGIQLAARIRQIRPDLPVGIATGYADLAADRSLARPHLLKPYRQQDLARFLAWLVGAHGSSGVRAAE